MTGVITKKDVDKYIKHWSEIHRLNGKGMKKIIDNIVMTIAGGGSVNSGSIVYSDTVEASVYFSGCGDEDISFDTKLLYFSKDEVEKYFIEKRKKRALKEKRRIASEKKEAEKTEEKLYLSLKEKYGDKV